MVFDSQHTRTLDYNWVDSLQNVVHWSESQAVAHPLPILLVTREECLCILGALDTEEQMHLFAWMPAHHRLLWPINASGCPKKGKEAPDFHCPLALHPPKKAHIGSYLSAYWLSLLSWLPVVFDFQKFQSLEKGKRKSEHTREFQTRFLDAVVNMGVGLKLLPFSWPVKMPSCLHMLWREA